MPSFFTCGFPNVSRVLVNLVGSPLPGLSVLVLAAFSSKREGTLPFAYSADALETGSVPSPLPRVATVLKFAGMRFQKMPRHSGMGL